MIKNLNFCLKAFLIVGVMVGAPSALAAAPLRVEVLADNDFPGEKELIKTFVSELKEMAGKRTPLEVTEVAVFTPGAKVKVSTSGKGADVSLDPLQVIGSAEYLRKTLQPIIGITGKRPVAIHGETALLGLAEVAKELGLGEVQTGIPTKPAFVFWPVLRPKDIDQKAIQDLRKKRHLVITFPKVEELTFGGFACLETEFITPLARLSALRAWRMIKGQPLPRPADILEVSPLLVVNQRALDESGFKLPLESLLQVEVRVIEPLGNLRALSLKRAQELALTIAPGLRANRLTQASGKEKELSAKTLKSLRVNATAGVGTQVGAGYDHEGSVSLEIVKPLTNREFRHRQTLAGLETELSHLSGESLKLRLEGLTMHRYLDVLENRAKIKIQEDQLTLLRRNMRIAKDRVAAGVAAPEEAGRQQVQAENTLANISQARDGLLGSLIALGQLTGEDIQESVLMDSELISEKTLDSLRPLFAPLRKTELRKALAKKLTKETVAKHPDFEMIRAREKQATASSRVVKALSTPTTQIETSLSHQDGQNFGNDRSSFETRVRMNIPIFSGGRDRFERKSRELDAKAQVEALQQEKEILEKDISQLLARLGQSAQSWDVLQKAHKTADENFMAVEARYQQGLLPQLNLIDAERELLTARTRSLTERILIFRSLISLFEKTGNPGLGAKVAGGKEWKDFLKP